MTHLWLIVLGGTLGRTQRKSQENAFLLGWGWTIRGVVVFLLLVGFLAVLFLLDSLSCYNLMKNLLKIISFILLPTTGLGNTAEIHSLNQLDEPRGYCIDIKGHKSKAKVDRGLQAHTCYSYQGNIAVDQGFDYVKLSRNEFYLPAFNVCMEAASFTSSSKLGLGDCKNENLQKFEWDEKDRIRLTDSHDLCITIAHGQSRNGGGGSPVHKIKNLSLEICSDQLEPYQIWGIRKLSN